MPRPARRSSEMKDVLTLLHLVAFQHQAVYRPAPHMAWRVTERQQQASSFNPSPFVPQLTHPTAGLLSGKTPLPSFWAGARAETRASEGPGGLCQPRPAASPTAAGYSWLCHRHGHLSLH